LEIFLVLSPPLEIYKRVLTSLQLKRLDSRSFFIVLSIKFSKWKEKYLRLKVRELLKRLSFFRVILPSIKPTLISKRSSWIC